MYNSLIVFRIYLFIILVFLIIISFLVSRDLLSIILVNIDTNNKNQFSFIQSTNIKNINNVITAYVKQKKWFSCISFLEFCSIYKVLDLYIIYKSLAYCYQKTNYYYIALYYYNKALVYDKEEDIKILENLINIYYCVNDNYNLLNVCEKILSFDSSNILASYYLSLVKNIN